MNKKDFKEADMFGPVRDFFAGLGYKVSAEVKGIDVVLEKDGVLHIIEMKKSFNVTLLFQAVDRQSVTSQVYVAIPRPRYVHGRESELTRRILKKLGLGLIFVKMDAPMSAEIDTFPPDVVKTPSRKRSERVKKEIAGRSVNINTGGQNKRPVGTAYREKAVKIACLLERYGAMTPADLVRLYGCDKNAGSILYSNGYGWFARVSKGVYELSALGQAALAREANGGQLKELVRLYRV